MFDRLVESENTGAVKSRRNYFALTAFAVSALSLTAIVVSIFADDFNIGTRSIELVELVAPVEMAEPAPQPKQQPRTQPVRSDRQTTQVAMRTENVRNIAEITDKVPPISTSRSTVVARPLDGRFEIGSRNTDAISDAGPGRENGTGAGADAGNGTGLVAAQPKVEVPDEAPPPRVEKKPAAPAAPKSGGVLNGKAIDLPKPAYSAAAKAVHAAGKVTVQVTLDETGRVISASAVDGNVLLRSSAVEAARRARFSPTLLSGMPVKVTGVIVYNFVS